MKKCYTFLAKNCLCTSLVGAFVVSSVVSSNAQTAPAKIWDKAFGGNSFISNNEDRFSSLQQTSDGGYILGGWSNSGISGDKTQASKGFLDFWVVKLDASGNKIWDKTIGGNGHDYLSCLQQTTDGGYILGGSSWSGISGDKSQPNFTNGDEPDYWIVKLDSVGNKLWDKTYGSTDGEELSSIQQTADGGYILGGSKGIDAFDFLVIKTDATGNKLWEITLGGNLFDETDKITALQQTSDGGYIAGGFSNSGINGDKTQASRGEFDFWVVKLNTYGQKVWDKTFGGNDQDWLTDLQQTSDGGYILGGESKSGLSGDKSQACQGNFDFWVIKIDSDGNKIWDKTLGGSAEDRLYSLQQTFDGNFVLGGQSSSGISGDKSQVSRGRDDFWFVKINSTGNKIWDKTLGGSLDDRLFSLKQTSDGRFVLGGSSLSSISGDKSQALNGYDVDYWIVKLGAEITGTSEAFSNSQIIINPNPNKGNFNLQLNGITTSKGEVIVSDLLGRVLLQKELPVANKQVSEELEVKAAKGMYLLQVKAGKQTTSRKIIVE